MCTYYILLSFLTSIKAASAFCCLFSHPHYLPSSLSPSAWARAFDPCKLLQNIFVRTLFFSALHFLVVLNCKLGRLNWRVMRFYCWSLLTLYADQTATQWKVSVKCREDDITWAAILCCNSIAFDDEGMNLLSAQQCKTLFFDLLGVAASGGGGVGVGGGGDGVCRSLRCTPLFHSRTSVYAHTSKLFKTPGKF